MLQPTIHAHGDVGESSCPNVLRVVSSKKLFKGGDGDFNPGEEESGEIAAAGLKVGKTYFCNEVIHK